MIKKSTLYIFRLIGGLFLIGLGIIFLFLPILQGWVTIFFGITMAFPKKGKIIINYLKNKRKLLNS